MDIDKAELKQRLLDDVDIEYICEQCGVEMRHRGRVTECLCPFHDDQHYGSARLRGKGIYCFACSRQYSVFDIVMKAFDMQYYEAYKYVAEQTGDLKNYMIPKGRQKNDPNILPLTRDELAMIGMKDFKIRIDLESGYGKPEDDGGLYYNTLMDDGRWMYTKYKTVTCSIRSFWSEDRAEALRLLGDATCEVADRYHKLYLKEPEYEDAYRPILMALVVIYKKLVKLGYKKPVKKTPTLEVTYDPALFF
jgi:hypothetical protein